MKEENTENTEQEAPRAGDPAIEALAAENEALKGEIRMRSAVYDVETKLSQAGARSPGLLTEQAKAAFQFGEDGNLTNGAAVVDHLRRTYPEQFGAGSIDGGAGRNTGPTLTKEALSRMTPAEINRPDWQEVRSVLSL